METYEMIEFFKPNGPEYLRLCLAAIILVVGAIIIWRAHRRVHRLRIKHESPAHKREMLTQRQKFYESLPPGQL